MKTKIKFLTAIAALIFTLSPSSMLKAQVFPMTNLLCGDVEIGYEISDAANPCGVCSFGTLIIPAGQTFNFPACGSGGFDRVCIWLIAIDYVSVGTSTCHNDCSPTGMCCSQSCLSGFMPSAACSPGSPYTITVMPGSSWQIN